MKIGSKLETSSERKYEFFAVIKSKFGSGNFEKIMIEL